MISIEEVKKWLSKNRVDENGNLNLIGLDFSDFDGNVDISNMRVKGDLNQANQKVEGNLNQCSQKVKGNLHQYCQEVKGDLNQANQKVKGNLYQCSQKVEGSMYLQDTSNLSKCTNSLGIICYRKIPEMTLEERDYDKTRI